MVVVVEDTVAEDEAVVEGTTVAFPETVAEVELVVVDPETIVELVNDVEEFAETVVVVVAAVVVVVVVVVVATVVMVVEAVGEEVIPVSSS